MYKLLTRISVSYPETFMLAENQTKNIWNNFVSVRFSGGIGSSLQRIKGAVNKTKNIYK